MPQNAAPGAGLCRDGCDGLDTREYSFVAAFTSQSSMMIHTALCRFTFATRSLVRGRQSLWTSWITKPTNELMRTVCPTSPTKEFSSTETNSVAKNGRFNVAFIGLGNMGLPMVLNLTTNDELVSSILVYDTNPEACLLAQEQGLGKVQIVQSIPTIMSASSDIDIIFTMLPSCEAVSSVMQKLQDGYVDNELNKILDDNNTASITRSEYPVCIIDCSTVLPSTTKRWNKLWKESCNYLMLDAPVSGGVKGAANGTLTFMVGSTGNATHHQDRETKALSLVIQPLLYTMGSNILWCGSPGSGAATKLCNNLALAAQMVGLCEALNLGERLGVDPTILTQAMNVSTASCWSSKVNNPHPVVAANMAQSNTGEGPPASRNYEGGFATNLMMKDLILALTAAEECGGVALPLTAATKRLYQSVSTKGLGTKDFGVMLEHLKSLNKND